MLALLAEYSARHQAWHNFLAFETLSVLCLVIIRLARRKKSRKVNQVGTLRKTNIEADENYRVQKGLAIGIFSIHNALQYISARI